MRRSSPTGFPIFTAGVWLLIGLSIGQASGQPGSGWKAHDHNRPRPPVVLPADQSLTVAPPSDAVVLFDGTETSLANWQAEDGGPTKWIVRDGAMYAVPGSGYAFSARAFGDCQLHVEWATPTLAEGKGQGRGNSGVFPMSLYEVQILDSYDNDTYPDGQAASIYGQYPPLVNASRPSGEWQVFDIVFRRPRFRPDGSVDHPARMTVFHNGVLVHNNRELVGPTNWLIHDPYQPHADKLPLSLQDHGNPVRFRNIWLREFPESVEPGPPSPSDPVMRLAPEVLKRYVGVYQTEEERIFRVRQKENRLQFYLYADRWFDMDARSKTEFAFRFTAAEVQFELGQDGVPTSVTFRMAGNDVRAARVNVETDKEAARER